MWQEDIEFSTLIGKTLVKVENIENEGILFITDDSVYGLYHEQDCCESVMVEDICGDLSDLVGLVGLASEDWSETKPVGIEIEWEDEAMVWTFYKINTLKGNVTIRWFGSSNGYYSVGVSFSKFKSESDFRSLF